MRLLNTTKIPDSFIFALVQKACKHVRVNQVGLVVNIKMDNIGSHGNAKHLLSKRDSMSQHTAGEVNVSITTKTTANRFIYIIAHELAHVKDIRSSRFKGWSNRKAYRERDHEIEADATGEKILEQFTVDGTVERFQVVMDSVKETKDQ